MTVRLSSCNLCKDLTLTIFEKNNVTISTIGFEYSHHYTDSQDSLCKSKTNQSACCSFSDQINNINEKANAQLTVAFKVVKYSCHYCLKLFLDLGQDQQSTEWVSEWVSEWVWVCVCVCAPCSNKIREFVNIKVFKDVQNESYWNGISIMSIIIMFITRIWSLSLSRYRYSFVMYITTILILNLTGQEATEAIQLAILTLSCDCDLDIRSRSPS